MRIKRMIFFGFSLLFLSLLYACKKNDFEVINNQTIDKIEISVVNRKFKDENERFSKINDPLEQEKIISDLNVLLNHEKVKVLDANKLTPDNDYVIKLYKNDKLVQKYTISKNVLSEGINTIKKYEVPKKDKDKLNNLKKHLEKITN
ncbi:hypothetical protein [Pseudolactococcus reticulitermitis]|uniref:Uncharacterized protein n=1 Tax=Pseudolactococcus reticulitermitis TaxID=2025039 RepID=A0A224X3W9_9LACT|nr:hypothetical protein [Lactococcus reticulitermitis]GAX47406.1 hypothetical protein RsY01_1006 [Lactococcus reticulitermitis]